MAVAHSRVISDLQTKFTASYTIICPLWNYNYETIFRFVSLRHSIATIKLKWVKSFCIRALPKRHDNSFTKFYVMKRTPMSKRIRFHLISIYPCRTKSIVLGVPDIVQNAIYVQMIELNNEKKLLQHRNMRRLPA